MNLLRFTRRKRGKIEIFAQWDDEARVWVATSKDVPGLVTEAETSEELVKKLKVMIPELLEANGEKIPDSSGIPFSVKSEREAVAG